MILRTTVRRVGRRQALRDPAAALGHLRGQQQAAYGSWTAGTPSPPPHLWLEDGGAIVAYLRVLRDAPSSIGRVPARTHRGAARPAS
jgi:hypothetical protein